MFVKFECGCVGFKPRDWSTGAVIVMPCDGDRSTPRETLSWITRDMGVKNCEAVSAEKEAELHLQIGRRFMTW